MMGRNLALNALDAGADVSGTDLGDDAVSGFEQEASRDVVATTDLDTFLESLPTPRNILVMVPAGKAVDSVLEGLAPKLSEGDLVIDGGNSFYQDTQRRQSMMDEKGLHFFGMGVSGGEEGARTGPSMMPGGPKEPYSRVAPVLEGMAASVDGEPCVAHLGEGASGHYVKMVHNGIEYGLMQLLAESYDLMKRGGGLGNDRMGDVFGEWNQGALRSYLVEITADILHQPETVTVAPDEMPGHQGPPEGMTGQYLLDFIKDTAKQKGTGKWTSQDAMDLGVPTPTIDAAVTARYVSALKDERVAASSQLGKPAGRAPGDPGDLVEALGGGMLVAFLATYAQGFALLKRASDAYEFGLDPETVARVWRGGCIIRADLLETFREAFRSDPDVPNLLVAPEIAPTVIQNCEPLRDAVRLGVQAGIPTPALATALAYLDAYRSEWLPANLVAAQRDYFGAHTFQRTDKDGTFHAQWMPAGI
ncbi:NADP-dependent phosphogluconate dehydrogenase [Rubrivirga sp.]|uniref:NADP-dependent phosphogluconate dehydrogenase n=1 Tax=Rubrivirga sp. TaxID=1885344 RepID=UPI003C73350E